MGSPPSQIRKLPSYLSAAIRIGTSPAEWPDAIACYERVYSEIVAGEGRAKARQWARKEAVWLFGVGLFYILR